MPRKELQIDWSVVNGTLQLRIAKQTHIYYDFSDDGDGFQASNGIYLDSRCEPEWTGRTLYCRGEDIARDNVQLPIPWRKLFAINDAVWEYNRHYA